MISCLRNECEEVVEAIEQKDPENLCEELGDVLLQVLLHAQIAKEYGSDEQNQARWEEIKRQEKEAKRNRKTAELQGKPLDKQ